MNKKYNITRIVHLNHLFGYIFRIRKYDLAIGLVLLIFSVVFSVVKINGDIAKINAQPDVKEKTVKVSEEEFLEIKTVLEYKTSMENQEQYNDESILMKINPTDKRGVYLTYTFENLLEEEKPLVKGFYQEQIGDKTALQDFLNKYMGETVAYQYYNEILTIEQPDNVNGVFVKIYHYDVEKLQKLCDGITAYMDTIRESANIAGLIHGFTVNEEGLYEVDSALQNHQNAKINNLTTFKTAYITRYEELTENQKQYMDLYLQMKDSAEYVEGTPISYQVEVNKSGNGFSKRQLIKYVIAIMLLFFLIRALCMIVYYFVSRKLLNENNIEDMFELKLLAKCKNSMNDEERDEMAKLLVLLLYDELMECKKLLVIGEDEEQEEPILIKELRKYLKERLVDLKFVSMKEITEVVKEVNTSDKVVLWEKLAVSKLQDIAEKKDICRLVDKKIVGVIVEDTKEKISWKKSSK